MDKSLKFWEAMKLVDEGKKVCREGWREDAQYAFLDEYRFGGLKSVSLKLKDGRDIDFSPIWYDMTSSDWFEVLD